MRKQILLLLLLFVAGMSAMAQKITVSGMLIEKETSEPVMSASVVLLKGDSTMACGANTDLKGVFKLPSVKAGDYILKVSYVGFITVYKNLKLTSENKTLDVGTIVLSENVTMLQGTEVTARVAQVEMKADTFVYNAAAYRLPEGSALEELVKKLPGAEVTEDGVIKINGKEVKKIMVDGKEFFSKDTKVAMKNLPTNMVEKIKAYDRQSDYTRVTGIDDGEEETVLDLSVKKGMKQGWLVNAELGYGTEDRYLGKFTMNRFTDKLKLSVLGSANNTNDRGFSGGGFGGWGGGGGLVSSKMAGVNFSWDNNKKDREAGKLEFGGNVRFWHNNTDSESKTNSETFLTGTSGSSFSNSLNKLRNGKTSVDGDFKMEWSPDSMTNIMFRPNFSYSENYSRSNSRSVTFNEDPYLKLTDPLNQFEQLLNDPNDTSVVNSNIRESMSDGRSRSVDGSLQINRRLNSTGRNLTLNLSSGYSSSDNKSFSISNVDYYQKKNGLDNTYTNQFILTPSTNYNYQAQLSYSEPLFTGANLQFSYRYQYRYSDSDRSMYSLDSMYSKYGEEFKYNLGYIPGGDTLDWCKNYLNSQYATYKEHNQEANVMFRYSFGEFRLNAGVSFQPQTTYMDYQKAKLDTTVTRNVYNWAPRVDVRWKYSETGQLRFRYNGYSGQPSMTNLLDVTDDSDPLNVSMGNPGLKPSWTNRFNLFYNNYIAELQRGWMVHANASMTDNSISTAVLYDEKTGKRTTMPMNINGNWDVRTGFLFNSALGEKKYFNVSTFTNLYYINDVGYISNKSGDGMDNVSPGDIIKLSQKSTTKSTNISERLRLNFRNDMFEFGVNGSINYRHARNELQKNANLDTYNFSYGANAIVNFPWNMSLATDLSEESRRGFDDASMNTNELIWNIQLSQSFLKNKAATFMLQWYDVLQERSNISRSISATQRVDNWTNSINSYVMARFVYKLNLMGNKQARSDMKGPGGHGDSEGGMRITRPATGFGPAHRF